MFKPWVTLPAKDVYIQLPLGLFDGEISIMFRNAEVIDSAIEQLKNLKGIMKDGRICMPDGK